MTRRLVIAVGGGGDVITSTALCRPKFDAVVSLVWEKLSADPHPGPRAPAELSHIEMVGTGIGRVTERTALPNGRITNQAILQECFPEIPQYVIDPYPGVPGIIDSLEALCALHKIDEVWGVDVGGDALSGSPSPTLTSPLVDAIFLSAMLGLRRKADLLVFGIGLDGEIPEQELKTMLINLLRSRSITEVHTLPMRSVDRILPFIANGRLSSEVSSLLFWSYKGMAGNVVMRDGGLKVRVNPEVMLGYQIPVELICKSMNPLGYELSDIVGLKSASEHLLAMGHRTELQDQIEILEGKEYQQAIVKGPKSLADILEELDLDVDYVAKRYLFRRMQGERGSMEREIASSTSLFDVGFHPFLEIRREVG